MERKKEHENVFVTLWIFHVDIKKKKKKIKNAEYFKCIPIIGKKNNMAPREKGKLNNISNKQKEITLYTHKRHEDGSSRELFKMKQYYLVKQFIKSEQVFLYTHSLS